MVSLMLVSNPIYSAEEVGRNLSIIENLVYLSLVLSLSESLTALSNSRMEVIHLDDSL